MILAWTDWVYLVGCVLLAALLFVVDSLVRRKSIRDRELRRSAHPPGWYRTPPGGAFRYWDGSAWTTRQGP